MMVTRADRAGSGPSAWGWAAARPWKSRIALRTRKSVRWARGGHTGPVQIEVVPFVASIHGDSLVDVLLELREQDEAYPPPRDAGGGRESIRAWLLRDDVLGRWVAQIDGRAAGHICVAHLPDYLAAHLAFKGVASAREGGFVELARLFVRPTLRRNGAATALLSTAVKYAFSRDAQPALAVVSTSLSAIRLYRSVGFRQVGEFNGVHGRNLVFLVERI